MPDVIPPRVALCLIARSRASPTLYQMFDPEGCDRIFICQACGNVFAPTPFEKQRIQRSPANGASNSPDRTDSSEETLPLVVMPYSHDRVTAIRGAPLPSLPKLDWGRCMSTPANPRREDPARVSPG